MYSKKSFGINTASCNEGSMRLRREWPWRARRLRISCLDGSVQYWYFFLLPPPPAILLFHISSDQCWECSNLFRRYSFFSRIQSLHHLLEIDDHDEEEYSVVLTLVSDIRLGSWLNISPNSFTDRCSSCRWASRSTSSWFCFSLWSARKITRFQS